jgi:hypothetical protein
LSTKYVDNVDEFVDKFVDKKLVHTFCFSDHFHKSALGAVRAKPLRACVPFPSADARQYVI